MGPPRYTWKERNPLRPIVDYTGSMAYNLSRSLADFLKPLVMKTEFFVKNTANFTKHIKDLTIQPDEIMKSHDVVSLFTNVPITETLLVIRHCKNTRPSTIAPSSY